MKTEDKYFFYHDLSTIVTQLSRLLDYQRKHPEIMTQETEDLVNAIIDKATRLNNRRY